MFRPAYLELTDAAFADRTRMAIQALADCRACPRDCGVNRLEDRWAACKTGRHAVVSSFFPLFGQEDCLRGWNGSGTIFFGHWPAASAPEATAGLAMNRDAPATEPGCGVEPHLKSGAPSARLRGSSAGHGAPASDRAGVWGGTPPEVRRAFGAPARERRGARGPRKRPSRGVGRSPT